MCQEPSDSLQLLLAYDPAKGPPPTAEIAKALEDSLQEPAILNAHREEIAFDAAYRDSLQRLPVPDDLAHRIKAAEAARHGPTPAPVEAGYRPAWLHFGLLGSIAAALIMLTLAYTFFLNPFAARATPELNAFLEKIETRFSDGAREEMFYDSSFDQLLAHLRAQQAPTPSIIPTGLNPASSYACREVTIDGVKVAMLCFREEDSSYHLFTFERAAIPRQEDLPQPVIRAHNGRHSATWTDEEFIYLLTTRAARRELETVL